MAKEPGTEGPTDDTMAAPRPSESNPEVGPAEQVRSSAHREPDEPEASEQIRRTDADRWAASFANIGDQPDSAGPTQSVAPNGTTQDASPASPDNDRPSWSDRVPVPPSGSSWRTDGPSQAWTTDVPTGFSWGSDSGSSTAQPVSDHASTSRAALEQSAQALPSHLPPPPPARYPNPPAHPGRQQGTDQQPGNDQYGNQPYGSDQYGNQPYGNHQYGGHYGEPGQGSRPETDQYPGRQSAGPPDPGQRSEPPPGSQSGWSAPAVALPPAPPQQWQQQEGAQVGWRPDRPQGPPPQQHTSAADLTSGSLVKPTLAVPRVGWRKMVHTVSGGTVNPGLSQAEMHRRNLIERATAPVRGCHRIAIVSLKGGIGKTTTTAGLGLTLAEHRGDRVVALDANPDAGTLAERLTGQVDVTVRDLLDNVDSIRSFTDVSAFTSLAARLQVLASEQDPEMSEAFNEDEYRTVADVLARYFNIVLTDSGTGLLHSAMSGTLALADSLVVVGSPSVDGASRASKTLDWLIAHDHGELVSRAVAVISTVRPATKELDMVRLREHFAARVRAVVEIPYDRHLVTGGIVDMTQLDRPTEHAFLELSATVADGFRLPPLTRSAPAPAGTSRG